MKSHLAELALSELSGYPTRHSVISGLVNNGLKEIQNSVLLNGYGWEGGWIALIYAEQLRP
jgi:hypothetical protein